MSRRRVVVTGLGCISPVGNTVAESWASLLVGRSGIGAITHFDAGAFACQFAGEVKGFNIGDYSPEKEARHMDRFIHLGLAAADQAVRDAGLPTGETCLNCHRYVTATLAAMRAEDAAAEKEKRAPKPVISEELKKLYDAMAVDAQMNPDPQHARPIEWVRVHNLPDFVHFDHRAHVQAGVACQHCHGPVETMYRMRQFSTLEMGWCVNCHRDANAHGLNGKRVNASIECATCHL